jgi:hypothetical protein
LSSWRSSTKLGRRIAGGAEKWESDHEPMGAAAGNGHQVDDPREAGSVAWIRAEAISVRSDQRQVGEGVDALRMCASASSL